MALLILIIQPPQPLSTHLLSKTVTKSIFTISIFTISILSHHHLTADVQTNVLKHTLWHFFNLTYELSAYLLCFNQKINIELKERHRRIITQ